MTRYEVLPYSKIVGQQAVKDALELLFVNPDIGGVLATGQRGTAKSTLVRSYSKMAYKRFPVTLPIGATEDRVIGGWEIQELVEEGRSTAKDGLLVEAANSPGRLLYVDEINLLDEYLVNIILDTLSTGFLGVHRDHRAEDLPSVRFNLVGTMNPDEGGLRPQLIDRFGLVVQVQAEQDTVARTEILHNVLAFEEDRDKTHSDLIESWLEQDEQERRRLEAARAALHRVRYGVEIEQLCAELATAFHVPGHRGELVLVRAARARAALDKDTTVEARHVQRVARPALTHRRTSAEMGTLPPWTQQDDDLVQQVVDRHSTRPGS